MTHTIYAREATTENFKEFGQLFSMADTSEESAEAQGLFVSSGTGWKDVRTRLPLLDTPASLGLTYGTGLPVEVSSMERHLHTQEALFCLDAAVAIAVAKPSAADAPNLDDVEAFIIQPGQVLVLNRGTWHDACHGIHGPAHYYWMATASEAGLAEWVPIIGGPFTLIAGESE